MHNLAGENLSTYKPLSHTKFHCIHPIQLACLANNTTMEACAQFHCYSASTNTSVWIAGYIGSWRDSNFWAIFYPLWLLQTLNSNLVKHFFQHPSHPLLSLMRYNFPSVHFHSTDGDFSQNFHILSDAFTITAVRYIVKHKLPFLSIACGEVGRRCCCYPKLDWLSAVNLT